MRDQNIQISFRMIVYTLLLVLGIYLIWISSELIYSLIIAFILMSAMRPLVTLIQRRGVSRTIAVFLSYLLFLAAIIFILFIVVPPIVLQIGTLISTLPVILQSLNPELAKVVNISSLTQYLPNVTNQLFEVISAVFSNLLFIVSTLFFGFYFLLEEDIIKRFFMQFLAVKQAEQVSRIIDKAEERMSSWFWGELTLMTIVGFMTMIGLQLIGMNYVVPLAVLAGILEAVPNIGPVLSAIPALIIGMAQSPLLGISSIILYTLIQQLENNLIVPVVMKRAVGINPIISLVVLILGGKIGGVLGVLLSIPVYLILETIAKEYLKTHTITGNLRK